jgi:dCMP deaminase
MSERWDRHYLERALKCSEMSKDPNTRVGAVIIAPGREPVSDGFNGLPRGIADTPERLNDWELKLQLIVHAEVNAVINASRMGRGVMGCTLYLAATDDTGLVWGGCPCTRCTATLIQAGIAEIVAYSPKPNWSKRHEDLEFARRLVNEAHILYRELCP